MVCTWLQEICSCSCLPVQPGPAWVLLSKIYRPFWELCITTLGIINCVVIFLPPIILLNLCGLPSGSECIEFIGRCRRKLFPIIHPYRAREVNALLMARGARRSAAPGRGIGGLGRQALTLLAPSAVSVSPRDENRQSSKTRSI